eukprot:scaffold15205_cov128-Cylindrotheca_fusiformis.AAC.2
MIRLMIIPERLPSPSQLSSGCGHQSLLAWPRNAITSPWDCTFDKKQGLTWPSMLCGDLTSLTDLLRASGRTNILTGMAFSYSVVQVLEKSKVNVPTAETCELEL